MRRTLLGAAGGGGALALVAYVVSLRDYGAGDGGEVMARLVRESYLGDLVAANLKLLALLVAAGVVAGFLGGLALVAVDRLRARYRRRALGSREVSSRVSGSSSARRASPRSPRLALAVMVGAVSFALLLARGLVAAFVESPGGVIALFPYDAARLDPIYEHVRPWMVRAGDTAGVILFASLLGAALAPPAVAWFERARRAVPRRVRARRLPVTASALSMVAFVGLAGSFGAHAASTRLVGQSDPRPNIVVLMSDSLRADRVGAWRGGQPVTPAIDALAARGCTFENCFVPVARTTESCVSLFTASWPQTHGIRTSWVEPERCRPLVVMPFPARFREAGYDTLATGEWNASDFGRFDLGFERVEVPDETWNVHTIVARGGRATAFLVRLLYGNALGAWLAPEIYHFPGAYGCDAVTARVGRALERAASSGRPSLVVAFYAPTHAPFTATGEHLHAFTDPTFEGLNKYGLRARSIDDAVSLQGDDMKARDLEQVKGIYDASVRTFDDQVAAVVEKINTTGLRRRTIVVVTSDHGTAFYERGSFGQGNEIASDVSNRIPLVVCDPRRERVAGARARHVVRSIDLGPTLCELAGIAAVPSWEGRSLVPVLDAPTRDLGLVAYAETGLWIGKQPWQSRELDFGFPSVYEMLDVPDRASGLIATKPEFVRLMIRAQHRMVRDDRWKLLYVPTRHEPRITLYDLASSSPDESTPPADVAAAHPDVVARLRRVLDGFLAREPREALERHFETER